MRKVLAVLLAPVGALVLGVFAPSPASAKVMPVAATVCGADECVDVGKGPGQLPFELMIPAIDPPRTSPPPAQTGEWYSVDLRFGPPAVRAEAREFRDEFPVAFLPGAGFIRTGVMYWHVNARGGAYAKSGGHWAELTPAEIAAYERVTEGVDSLPASALPPPGDKVFNLLPARGAEGATAPATDRSSEAWAWLALGVGALLGLVAAGVASSRRGRSARRADPARS